jgi:hypothetical protein
MFTAMIILSFVCLGLGITCIYLILQVRALIKLEIMTTKTHKSLYEAKEDHRSQLIIVSKLSADNHKRLNEVVELVKKLDGGLKNYVQDKNKRLGANQKIK